MNHKGEKSFSLRKHLIQGAFGSLLLRVAQTGIGLLLAIVLARILGVESYGTYAFCLTVVNLLTIPAMLGGQTFLIREVASYKAKGEVHHLVGLLKNTRLTTTLVSCSISFFVAIITIWICQGSRLLVPLLIAAALIPLMTGINIQGAALQGLNHILLGNVHTTLLPLFVLVIIFSMFLLPEFALTPEKVLFAHVASTAIIFVATFFFLEWSLPENIKKVQPAYETDKWIKSIFPFLMTGGMQILNKEASVFLLGILEGTESVGLFRVAQRGSELIPLGLVAVNMAIAPIVSELFTRDEKLRLQHLINKSILAIMAFALPVTIVLVFGGRWLIPFVFGKEFNSAYIPLIILCAGQLVNAGMGSVGLLLNMAGLERMSATGVALATLSNIVLNLTLIPFWGTTGAACATSTSLILWNILLSLWLYRETGIRSSFTLKKPRGKRPF